MQGPRLGALCVLGMNVGHCSIARIIVGACIAPITCAVLRAISPFVAGGAVTRGAAFTASASLMASHRPWTRHECGKRFTTARNHQHCTCAGDMVARHTSVLGLPLDLCRHDHRSPRECSGHLIGAPFLAQRGSVAIFPGLDMQSQSGARHRHP